MLKLTTGENFWMIYWNTLFVFLFIFWLGRNSCVWGLCASIVQSHLVPEKMQPCSPAHMYLLHHAKSFPFWSNTWTINIWFFLNPIKRLIYKTGAAQSHVWLYLNVSALCMNCSPPPPPLPFSLPPYTHMCSQLVSDTLTNLSIIKPLRYSIKVKENPHSLLLCLRILLHVG